MRGDTAERTAGTDCAPQAPSAAAVRAGKKKARQGKAGPWRPHYVEETHDGENDDAVQM